jgi:hypothetical protein
VDDEDMEDDTCGRCVCIINVLLWQELYFIELL